MTLSTKHLPMMHIAPQDKQFYGESGPLHLQNPAHCARKQLHACLRLDQKTRWQFAQQRIEFPRLDRQHEVGVIGRSRNPVGDISECPDQQILDRGRLDLLEDGQHRLTRNHRRSCGGPYQRDSSSLRTMPRRRRTSGSSFPKCQSHKSRAAPIRWPGVSLRARSTSSRKRASIKGLNSSIGTGFYATTMAPSTMIGAGKEFDAPPSTGYIYPS